MQGVLETLATGFFLRALGPGLGAVLMAAPARKTGRAQLKKVYVLNEMGDMDGEYILDPDCPIDYNDFLKVLPDDGIGDREALFVGEYVFTAFQSGKYVFVLLSRGQLGPEDMDWTATLLSAADAHLAAESRGGIAPRPEPKKPNPEAEAAVADHQSKLDARERELAKLEVQLKADEANLKGRVEELARQKERLAALADYVSQMQQSALNGADRSQKALAKMEELATTAEESKGVADAQALASLRQQFDDERKALLAARDELEAKYREATARVQALEREAKDSTDALEKERTSTAAREAEAERMRATIEVRVQELSQRFAAMAKERIVAAQTPAAGGEAAQAAEPAELETVRAELAKERKFLQRRAIEMLDREEKVRAREMALEEREGTIAKRERDLAARQAAGPQAAPGPEVEEARKDIELRVKIIQQKALELLDREEKLRKRAEELQALEARLSGSVPAR